MKKYLFIILAFAVLFVVLKVISVDKSSDDRHKNSTLLSYQVDEHVQIRHPSRIGINLGSWSNIGTLGFSKNVLLNPGLEGKINRCIVLVSHSDDKGFSDEAGQGYPDHFWDEAEYHIRSGNSLGKKGVITKSLNSGVNGLPQYLSKGTLPPLSQHDVIVLTKTTRPSPSDFWRANDPSTVFTDPYKQRTESRGTQSICLSPKAELPALLYYPFDATAQRTGNLVSVIGPWRFSFWAKGEKPGAEIQVSFERENKGSKFFRKTVSLDTQWKEYTLNFQGNDNGIPGSLKLSLSASVENNSVWIDDLWLGREDTSSLAFPTAVVDSLKQLKPSFLRTFAPLGDTWENQIALPFERKPWNYQLTGSPPQLIYNYSISEFLDLCSAVGANPWLIIPPGFSDFECTQMANFLAEKASKVRFSEVILEFGYENWNWLYRPAVIPYPAENGFLANRMFNIISKQVEGKVNLRTLVNGQNTSASQAMSFVENASKADGLAIAPYFFYSLDKGTPDEEILHQLFRSDSGFLREISDKLFVNRKSLAVYEINLHTTMGDAKAFERNRVVAGMASGSALAKRILESLFVGANPVMVYNFGQQEVSAWEIDDYVKLWGIIRDFGPPLKFRPTGLAVYMLNQVIDGNLHPIRQIEAASPESEALTLAAFKTPKLWTAAIISSHDTPLTVELLFPEDRHPLPTTITTLHAKSLFDTNETEENVTLLQSSIESKGRLVKFTIPPRGFVILKDSHK